MQPLQVKSPCLDAEFASQNEFFLNDRFAVGGLAPVVRAIVRDVEDVISEAEFGAHVPRAQYLVPKPRVPGRASKKWAGGLKEPSFDPTRAVV